MPAIILPGGKQRYQPKDFSPALSGDWAGIVGFASVTGRSAAIDAKSRTLATPTGTISVVPTVQGLASKASSATSTRLSWTSLQPVAAMGDGYAMLVYAAPASAGALQRAFSLGAEAASAYTNAALIFNSSLTGVATAGRVAFKEYSGSDKGQAETASTEVTGDWRVFIVNRPAGTYAPSIYVDGRDATLASTSSAGVAFTAGVHVHGQPTSTTTGYDGLLSLAVAFRRPLSISEIRDLSQNPWQIFRKSPGRVYFFPSAAGGAYTLDATSGSFALTGSSVELTVSRNLDASSGSFALTGSNVSLELGRVIDATSGSYALTGTNAELSVGRQIDATSGSFAITGTDVDLTYTPAGAYSLDLNSGSYALTGSTVSLEVGRQLDATSGTFSITGTDVDLARGYAFDLSSGSYSFTGTNVDLTVTRLLDATSGAFYISGTSVSLTWSGEPVDVTHVTGGGGSRKMLVSERKVRDEVDEWLKKKREAALKAQIAREDDEICLIMAALAA